MKICKNLIPKLIYLDGKVYKVVPFDYADTVISCSKCAFNPKSCGNIPFDCFVESDNNLYNFYFVETNSLRAKLFKFLEDISAGELRTIETRNEDLQIAQQYLDKIYKFEGQRFRSMKCNDCRLCDLRNRFVPYCKYTEPCQVKENGVIESWVYRNIDSKFRLQVVKFINLIAYWIS